MLRKLLVDALLLEDFTDCVDVDEVNEGKDVFGLAPGDALAVGEQPTPLVLKVGTVLR